MILKYYIDTSVFGGYYDVEFQEFTRIFFDNMVKNKIRIMYSELTENELKDAPERVKSFIKQIPKDLIDFVEITNESFNLANQYVNENVVGKTSHNDCIHIALATINRADVLISWNFKHIVNLKRIHGYNSVNLKLGYPTLEIRSPKEMIDYEDNS